MEQNMFFFIGLALIACGRIGLYNLKVKREKRRVPMPNNVVPISRGWLVRAARLNRSQKAEFNWTENHSNTVIR